MGHIGGCLLRRGSLVDTPARLLLRKIGTMNHTTERLLELDVRHGELLDKLAWLDQKVDDVLKEWTTARESQPETNESQS